MEMLPEVVKEPPPPKQHKEAYIIVTGLKFYQDDVPSVLRAELQLDGGSPPMHFLYLTSIEDY